MPANTPANDAGIAFAASADGQRSSTALALAVISAALKPLDGPLAQEASGEARWRSRYPHYVNALVARALAEPESALASARAGLAEAWQRLSWCAGGREMPLEEAFAAGLEGVQRTGTPPHLAAVPGLQTHLVQGEGPAAAAAWSLPLRGRNLAGQALLAQLDDWQARHIIEPGAAEALRRCVNHPEWFDLSDRTFVLLGAGSEAGPLRWLARWRSNIIAVDVARPEVWKRIAGVVRSGNARMFVPVSPQAPGGNDGAPSGPSSEEAWLTQAGCDLLTQTPAVIAWLQGLQKERGQPFDVASHAYLDGEKHVRITMAMDWVVRALSQSGPDNSFAWMATPTDVFAVPEKTARQAMQAWAQRSPGARLMKALTRPWGASRFFQPNVTAVLPGSAGKGFGVVDSLVLEQGPNYALAKRLQQWRAMDLRMQGRRVSLNIAPSTTTTSVVKNPALKAGFAGADVFGLEVFEPETTNALMAALWVHDLRYGTASSAAPQAASEPGGHPFELLMDQACHGGLWTMACKPRSVLPFAAALGWLRLRLR